MNQVKFVEDSLYKNWSDMVCLGRYMSDPFSGTAVHSEIQAWFLLFSGLGNSSQFQGISCVDSSKTWLILQYSTAWKLSKYGVFSGTYFPLFGLNTGKYGP